MHLMTGGGFLAGEMLGTESLTEENAASADANTEVQGAQAVLLDGSEDTASGAL